MGAAFAAVLPPGGTVVLVDAEPELLRAATAHVRAVDDARVEVRAVQADAADDALLDLAPRADLVFASSVVHHLPDQQRGVERLAALVRPGGRLGLVESGLEQRCLPWDVGLGEPGLQGRLSAAHAQRSGMREVAEPWISEPDLRTVGELLDEQCPHYIGRRDDVFVLAAHTVHLGTAPG